MTGSPYDHLNNKSITPTNLIEILKESSKKKYLMVGEEDIKNPVFTSKSYSLISNIIEEDN